jgi:hypothetical protein
MKHKKTIIKRYTPVLFRINEITGIILLKEIGNIT